MIQIGKKNRTSSKLGTNKKETCTKEVVIYCGHSISGPIEIALLFVVVSLLIQLNPRAQNVSGP